MTTISLPSYEIMGKRVACRELQATRSFSLEHEVYPCLKRHANTAGWKFIRVDTQGQQGFPDCLLLKGKEYWLVEVKMLKTKKLKNPLDNVTWQPGQIPFMLQALQRKHRYLLVIAKADKLLILGEENNVRSMFNNTNNLRFI